MIILGISFLADASACLLVNGKIIAAISEERINREKLWNGIPHQSIEQVLKIGGVSFEDIDFIATHGTHLKKPDITAFQSAIHKIKISQLPPELKKIQITSLEERFDKEEIIFTSRTPEYIDEIKQLGKKVFIYEHHQAHASTAFFGSGWEHSYVLTADGWGEDGSNSFWNASGNYIKKISSSSTIDSLGYFYGSITKSLGFIPHRHEGKILGLAAYDTKQESYDTIKDMISFDKQNLRFTGNAHNGIYKPTYVNPELDLAITEFTREDVASSAQRRLEEVILDFLSEVDDDNINLSLAGGIFANVKVNQRIKDHPKVSKVYVFPNMGDGGLSIGAAWLAYSEITERRPDPLNTALIGNNISEEKILDGLKKTNFRYKKIKSINQKIAELLANGQVVARVSGCMEFGPRALGNRSILYRATDNSVNSWLNKNLNRSEFMPFAPMTLIDDVEKYYLNIDGGRDAAKYMTMTFDCSKKMIDEAPATVHIDKTARPQFISKKDYPDMYEILSEYKKLTGLSNIVNTSFNMHEEPIVSSEHDAIESFTKSGLKWMALGSYLVENKEKEDI